MSYIIYRKSDSKIMEHPRTRTRSYGTEKSANAALTKMINSNRLSGERSDYDESEYEYYTQNIEQYVTVRNLMSGEPVRQSINTPRCCDVSSELYWSM